LLAELHASETDSGRWVQHAMNGKMIKSDTVDDREQYVEARATDTMRILVGHHMTPSPEKIARESWAVAEAMAVERDARRKRSNNPKDDENARSESQSR
jgi:hypothetical protein